MARTKISEFSATPGNNTDIDSINIAENCAPSGINDAIRELMAQLKDFQTGAVGDSFNGPVGTTTAAAGAFTTLSASSTVSGTGFSTYLASPPSIGSTAAGTGAFTTLAASGAVTLSGGTANGVPYLNGSKVLTSGSALVFDGSNLGLGVTPSAWNSVYRAVQLGGSAIAGRTGGNNLLELSSNAYRATSGDYIYLTTNLAARYDLNDGLHRWFNAPSGTAGNAITFTQAMTLDASGRLGVGTISPGFKLDINGVGNFQGIQVGTNGDTINGSLGLLSFQTSGTERARIDSSGNLLVGTTTTGFTNSRSFTFQGVGDGKVYVNHSTANTNGDAYIGFGYNGTQIGSITQNGTTQVLYNVSSDHRLKDITGPVTGTEAKDFIMALQPKQGTWKADDSRFVGFVAHEFQEVSPLSVTGTKDAVDAEGNPVMQAMQASSPEVMANLIAHIQNLEKRLAALEAAA